jgi:uncharacterized membrane protein YuzA (DUF378 family)
MILLNNQILFYGAAAASTFIAGVLHLAIVPMFFSKMPTNVTIFFIISGLAQLFWVIPLIEMEQYLVLHRYRWYSDFNYIMDSCSTSKGVSCE